MWSRSCASKRRVNQSLNYDQPGSRSSRPGAQAPKYFPLQSQKVKGRIVRGASVTRKGQPIGNEGEEAEKKRKKSVVQKNSRKQHDQETELTTKAMSLLKHYAGPRTGEPHQCEKATKKISSCTGGPQPLKGDIRAKRPGATYATEKTWGNLTPPRS